MGNLDNIEQIVGIIRDIFGILSGIIVSVVAILGLRAWRKQLKGNTEYDLGRRLLNSVYKIRDAINHVRNPFVGSSELGTAVKEAGLEIDPADSKYDGKREELVYQRRWKVISEAINELNVNAFEAEALWGDDVRELITDLRRHIGTLFTNVEDHLRQYNANPRREYSYERRERIDKVIYDFDLMSENNENEFSVEIFETIRQIEQFLKPKIKL